MRNIIIILSLSFANNLLFSATDPTFTDSSKILKTSNNQPPKKEWYQSIQLRGYAQIRYNRLFETNSKLVCDQCDKSMGENGGIFIRRLRLILSGQIHPRVYMYIQPDFASSASSTALHFGQIRDAYFDLGLNNDNSWRIRIGQSKVPFGFINMQSSQNRLNLDRDDAMNSMVSNERDMGAFLYWAPAAKRELFAKLVSSGLKGSGDYGCFGYGVYNGQTANKPEENNNLHQVIRFTYPMEIGNQIIEPSIQAITGDWTMPTALLTKKVEVNPTRTYLDQRVAATFVLYPQPFGIQAEFMKGTGPRFNKNTDSIESANTVGGYILASYRTKIKGHTVIPFIRYVRYDGSKKFETDARAYDVEEIEGGIEWEPTKQFELVIAYNYASRRFEDYGKQDNLQVGRFLRIQAQVNF